MATPKKDKTRNERASEIEASEIVPQTDGFFLVKGKYLTDGKNCECGDNRFRGNDCIHAIRVRELYNLPIMPHVAIVAAASNVVQLADFR